MAQNPDPQTSALDGFFLKLGTVLSLTKDALLADFIGDFPSYVPPDKANAETLSNAFATATAPLSDFIDYVFRRLGYDLKKFDKSEELYDLVKALLATTDSLGANIAALASDDFSWQEEAKELVKKAQGEKGEKVHIDTDTLFKEVTVDGEKALLRMDDGKGNYAAISIGDLGDGGKIGKIINIVIDIFDLLKKFRDLEWDKIGKEYESFGKFMEDSYFNKEFAERLFDHILTVLLSKAREVFDEEIREMAKEIGKFTKDIQKVIDEAQGAIGKTVDEIKDEVQKLLDQIEAVKKQIEAEAQNLYDQAQALYKGVYGEVMDAANEAKATVEDFYDQVSGELLAQYKMLQNELTALMKMSLGPFGKLGDVLDRIYHVLDFLGLIQKRTIEIARFFPDKTLVDTIETFDAAKFDKLVNQANLLSDVTGDLDLESLQKDAVNAVAELKESIPTVEINVIRWSRLEQLFTKPEDYFHEVFPIHDYDDAEALLVRLAGLVRSFNPDIFDFSSISNILNELFVRLRKAAAEAEKSANEDFRELKDKIVAIEKFILEIKRVLECYAIEFKKEFMQAFKNVRDGAKSVLDDLKKDVQTAINTVKKEAGKTGQQFVKEANVLWRDFSKMTNLDESTKTFLYNLFAKPLEELIAEKAAEHNLFASVDPSAWTAPIDKSFSTLGSGATDLAQKYIDVLKDIQKRIESALDGKQWEARFKKMSGDLEKEFIKQTAAIPSSVDEFKAYGKETITKLIQGDTPNNPFSGFDFTAYISILSDHVKELIPTDLDLYYTKFRDITIDGITKIIDSTTGIKSAVEGSAKNIGLTVEKRAEAVKLFVSDVYAGYWPKLKDAFYKMVIRPVLTMIEKTVKAWAKELLKEIVKKVVDAVKKIDIDTQAVEKAVEGVMTAVDTAATVAEQILLLKAETEEKGVDTWSDALKLAIKIYGLIPEDVKDFVRDIIDLPKIDVDIHLPEYKLDIDNKFLAVKLYELAPTKVGSGNAQAMGSVTIQLLAFVGDREDKSGLYLYPFIKGELDAYFNLGATHALQLNASASLNEGFEKPATKKDGDDKSEQALKDGIGLFITEAENFSFDAELLTNTEAITAWLELYFSRGHFDNNAKLQDVGPLVIYDSEVFSITADDYPQKAYIGYAGGFDAGYRGEIRKLKLGLDLRKLNSFFEALLSNKIELNLDKLALGYSYKNGLDVEGSVSVRIPINKNIDLKAAKLSGPAIEVGFPDLRGVSFGLSLNSLALNLGCVHFSLADLGFSLKSDLFDSRWHFNDFNLSPSLKLPDGIGLSIDLEGAVKGTGALKWNKEKGEVIGAAELVVVDLFGASALFILNMKETDGVKFSFMGAISVYFTPGIQLGMGFSLTAVGGALGLFRRIDTDRMQQAVHEGTLSTVMFVKDLDKNLDTVLANMTSYYPISKENFFFGVMAQISWAEKVKVELGLFIQAPDPVVIMIAGGLHFNVADSLDKLLSINANFLGIIDLSKGLSFDASLYDSYIVGIQFYGDIALRIYWAGETKGFLLSAGGFHPQYTPEAGFNVANMKRLGMKLDIGPVKFSMEEYFAVTSNTVQFGSDTRLQIGWDKFGISGYMYYNVLFQFRPFAFSFDAGIGVAVKCGSWTLMSIALALEVSGPRPWHFKGTASFWFLFIKIEVGIEETWGKKQEVAEQSRIAVFPLYSDEFSRMDNWTVISTDLKDKLVTIAPYEGDELMMNSSDTLFFSQEAVPLNKDIERFGESIPSLTRIELTSVNVGTKEIKKQTTTTSFAPSMFKNMTDKEKLAAPSYEKMPSGFIVKDDKDMDMGPRQSITIEPDKHASKVDMANWEKAVNLCTPASKAATPKAATPKAAATQTASKQKQIIPIMKSLGVPSRPPIHIAGASEKDASRVYRPSYRRTDEGFNRYIKALDGSMGNNLSSLKEILNEQSEA